MNIDDVIAKLQLLKRHAEQLGIATDELWVLIQESPNDFAPLLSIELTGAGLNQPAIVIKSDSRY